MKFTAGKMKYCNITKLVTNVDKYQSFSIFIQKNLRVKTTIYAHRLAAWWKSMRRLSAWPEKIEDRESAQTSQLGEEL